MSKYRRKTANLRERERMGEINKAFEHLRTKIPTPLAASDAKSKCEKMTKINILHVAINYIKALESILDTGEAGVQVYGTSIVRSPFHVQDSSNSPMDVVEAVQTYKKSVKAVKMKSSKLANVLKAFKANKGHSKKPDQDEPYCPDWTELTCTLDFSTSPRNSVESSSSPPSSPDSGLASSPPVRRDLDTMLSSISSGDLGSSVVKPLTDPDQLLLEQVLKSLPSSTTATKVPSSNEDALSNTSGLFSRQISFTELLEGGDPDTLFADLNDLSTATNLDEYLQQQIMV